MGTGRHRLDPSIPEGSTAEPGRVDLGGAVEDVFRNAYLQLRSGILLQGLGRLAFDGKRFRQPLLAYGVIGGYVAESAWLWGRSRRAPLVEDQGAVFADVAFTAAAQVLIAAATDPEVLAEGPLFSDFASVWASVAIVGWVRNRPLGLVTTAGLWGLSCALVKRTGHLSRGRAAEALGYYAAFYSVGWAFVGLVRRYVRLTIEAEAEAVRSAGETARAETRSELHRTVHRQTLQVLETLQGMPFADERARSLAISEALRLRRVLSDPDGATEPVDGSVHDTVEQYARAGIRLEVVNTLPEKLPPRVSSLIATVLRTLMTLAAKAEVTTGVLRLAADEAAVNVTLKTRRAFLGTGAPMSEEIAHLVDEISGSIADRSDPAYGTRVTLRIPR